MVLSMQELARTMDETRILFFAHRGREDGFLSVNSSGLILLCFTHLTLFCPPTLALHCLLLVYPLQCLVQDGYDRGV